MRRIQILKALHLKIIIQDVLAIFLLILINLRLNPTRHEVNFGAPAQEIEA